MNSFLNALSFLSVIPVPSKVYEDNKALRYSWIWFPYIGLILGCAAGGIFFLCISIFGIYPLLSATLSFAFGAIITRGLHYDGLCDMVDAAFGGYTVEDRLRILKDPRIGSFAAIALIIVVLLQIQLISLLPPTQVIQILATAGVLARWATIYPMLYKPYAKKTGLGLLFEKSISKYILTTIVTLVVVYLLLGFIGILLVVIVHIVAILISSFASRRFGGMVGDVFGTIIVVCEITTVAGYAIITNLLTLL